MRFGFGEGRVLVVAVEAKIKYYCPRFYDRPWRHFVSYFSGPSQEPFFASLMDQQNQFTQSDDDFWSIALTSESPFNKQESDDENDENEATKKSFSFAIPAPKANLTEEPLTILIRLNNGRGVLDDVSGIPWDASLILAGYLYGTHEGRSLCYNACSCTNSGGILELGSGLGLTGLAATAAAMKFGTHEERILRIVLTDRNDHCILSHLKENVDLNVSRYHSVNEHTLTNVSVEACDWMEVSIHLRTIAKEQQMDTKDTKYNFPQGQFHLILGSALIYVPEHAIECADTIYYYLSDISSYSMEHTSYELKRQAIIVQLPDRSGFATHFLPRCQELGLNVVCEEVSEELIEIVESGLKKTIPSIRDYRMYFITKQQCMRHRLCN